MAPAGRFAGTADIRQARRNRAPNAARASREAAATGASIAQLYGRLDELSQFHHDQLVEMRPDLAVRGGGDDPALAVYEYVRLSPGARGRFLSMVSKTVVPFEEKSSAIRRSETGVLFLSDGWDVLRVLGFDTLAAFHAYLAELEVQPWLPGFDETVAARKRILLRPDPELRVR